jgi:hypothetical protein
MDTEKPKIGIIGHSHGGMALTATIILALQRHNFDVSIVEDLPQGPTPGPNQPFSNFDKDLLIGPKVTNPMPIDYSKIGKKSRRKY